MVRHTSAPIWGWPLQVSNGNGNGQPQEKRKERWGVGEGQQHGTHGTNNVGAVKECSKRKAVADTVTYIDARSLYSTSHLYPCCYLNKMGRIALSSDMEQKSKNDDVWYKYRFY